MSVGFDPIQKDNNLKRDVDNKR